MGAGLVGVMLGCGWVALAQTARADDPVAICIGASERSLDLRKQGKLLEARRELVACAASTCPDVIQQACAKRIAEINAALPSVVLEVKDGLGQSIAASLVSVDGKPPVPVGVVALPMDPGPHMLRFQVAGQPPVDKNVGLLEGEKEKRIAVVVGPPGPEGDKPHARLVISSDAGATVAVDRQTAVRGRLDAEFPSGPHDVEVSESGKVPYRAQIELQEGETRSLTIVLEDEKKSAMIWPWIAGGVAVAAGAVIGGYFLFKPQDQTAGVPPGRTATLQLSLTGR